MKESLYRDSRYNDMAVKLPKKSLYRGKPKELNDKELIKRLTTHSIILVHHRVKRLTETLKITRLL